MAFTYWYAITSHIFGKYIVVYENVDIKFSAYDKFQE